MADLLLPMLIGGGGGALSWLLNKIPGLGPSATNINQDYVNNPIWQQLFGSGKGYANANKGMESFLANAVTGANAYDPNAFWRDFIAAQPEMQGLIQGETGSVKAAQQANLSDFIKQAVSETGQELSGMGALYSGAMSDITGQKVGREAAKSNVDLSTLQAQMLSGLMGQAMGGFQSGRQFQTSNLVNTYLGGANMYNSQLAQMLGIGADLSAPVYQTQPGLADSIMGGIGLGMQGASAAAMIPSGSKKTATTPVNFYIPGLDQWGGSEGASAWR